MRQWLHDPRAYYVLKHWLQSDQCRKEPGYNVIENFRAWVAQTADHFFDVTGTWTDSDTLGCCRALGAAVPSAAVPTPPPKKETHELSF